jgi:histidine triad (HIT) family protein
MAEYDSNNIFARILRGEIPNRTVLETDHALAFHDIGPKAPVHVLVIPRGAYADFADFTRKAGPAEAADFWSAVQTVIDNLGIADNGYRLIANSGADGMQEVPHFHVHILAGQRLGPLLAF